MDCVIETAGERRGGARGSLEKVGPAAEIHQQRDLGEHCKTQTIRGPAVEDVAPRRASTRAVGQSSAPAPQIRRLGAGILLRETLSAGDGGGH